VSSREFSLPIRVYIEDTDAGGIVYYVNYLKFMERARTEWMRSLGYDRDFIFNHNLMFVVRKAQVEYLAPARLDDQLLADAAILEVGAAQLLLKQRVIKENGDLLSEGKIQLVCVDRQTMKAKRLPRELLKTLREQLT